MAVVLDARAKPEAVHRAIHLLVDLFAVWSGSAIDAVDGSPEQAVELPLGKAISPSDAARCMRDVQRTTQFLRGIHLALGKLLATQRERPLHVVYAGCGPFAALVLPLMPFFDPADAVFHLIDVHRPSLDSCRRLVHRLGLEASIAAYVAGDATVDLSINHPVHMVITETMQAALEGEPQVAVACALAPQLCEGGVLIPQRIRLIATLLDPQQEFTADGAPSPARIREDLGVVFELDLACAQRINKVLLTAPDGVRRIPGGRVILPDPIPPRRELWVRTHIQVFDSIELDDYESGLTAPTPAAEPLTNGQVLQFFYELGPAPHLVVR